MELGERSRFALVIEPLGAGRGRLAEQRTLARVEVWCGGRNLCEGTDEAGRFTALDVPLIDLADWLVTGWEERTYDDHLPEVLATRFRHSVPLAARWRHSQALDLDIEEASAIHRWAEVRALEFAATDYVLPNVVFDRVDDYVRVSWAQVPEDLGWSDVRFDPAEGTILVDVREFVELARRLVEETMRLAGPPEEDGDPRVAALHGFVGRDAADWGRRAVRRWGATSDLAALVPRGELADLGATGQGGAVSAFLRSSSGVLSSDAVRVCLRLAVSTAGGIDGGLVSVLTRGAPVGIDPVEPWESGLELARHVRMRLAERGYATVDAPLPVDRVLDDLGVRVERLDFGEPEVDGACFRFRDGRALAVLNTGGRLSRTRVGQRSTLAHELCHFLFDASRFRELGRADLRGPRDSIVEKRANAFAAELLLPRRVVRDAATGARLSRERLRKLARSYGVGMVLATHQAENAGIRLES